MDVGAFRSSSSPAVAFGIQFFKTSLFHNTLFERSWKMYSIADGRLCAGFVLVVLLTLVVLAGCGGSGRSTTPAPSPAPSPSPTPNPLPSPTPTPTPSPGPTITPANHLFLVVLANHSATEVLANPAMPYLNALASKASLATNYFANAHHSI